MNSTSKWQSNSIQGLSKYGQKCYHSWYVAIVAIIDPCLLSTVLHFWGLGFGSFSEHGQIVKQVYKSLLYKSRLTVPFPQYSGSPLRYSRMRCSDARLSEKLKSRSVCRSLRAPACPKDIRRQDEGCFIGPADCNHCDCSHNLFSESGRFSIIFRTGSEVICAYSCSGCTLLALWMLDFLSPTRNGWLIGAFMRVNAK